MVPDGVRPAPAASRSRAPIVVVVVLVVLGGVGALLGQRLLSGGAASSVAPTAQVLGSIPSPLSFPTTLTTALPGSSPGPQSSASGQATSTPFDQTPGPTVGPVTTPRISRLEALMALIPSSLQPYCSKSASHDPSISGYGAIVECDLTSDLVVFVRYWSYPDAASLDDQWSRRMAALAVKGFPVGTGDCWTGQPGETSHALGRLQCDVYPTDQELELRWTDRRSLIYGTVDGKAGVDIASLTQWWSQNAVLGGTSP